MNIFKHQCNLFRLCSFLFVFIIGVFGMAPVYAVHLEGTFELDGNVADPAGDGDDWATVNNPLSTSGSFIKRTGVKSDPGDVSIFTGGGSKDDLDITQWLHKTGAVPDKDNITNAYAAAYAVPNTAGSKDLVIYAGADRFDTSGDAFMAFWFFQEAISLTNTRSQGGFKFSGKHVVGDILVLANFTGGGTTVGIEVFKWVGTGGEINGTLTRVAGNAAATCNGAHAGPLAEFCGKTNTTVFAPTWPYLSKSGTTTFPVATFFEIGINISKVLGAGNVPCFSSFSAETRSSSSVDAVLKDFVLGGFELCGIAVSKNCGIGKLNSTTAPPTIDYPISGQVQNSGFGQLTNVNLVDNPPVAFTYHQCLPSGQPDLSTTASLSPLNAQATVCYKGSYNSPSNGASDTVTVSGSSGAATVTATAGATCDPIPTSPAISVTKNCTVGLDTVSSLLAVKIGITGQVCNTGDQPLSNVSLTDTDGVQPVIALSGVPTALAIGACADYTGSYHPQGALNRLDTEAPFDPTLVPGLAMFKDTVTANATATFGTVTPAFVTATCNLCPTCTPDACLTGACRTSDGATSGTSSLFKKR